MAAYNMWKDNDMRGSASRKPIEKATSAIYAVAAGLNNLVSIVWFVPGY
jgi:hypothetical protein